MRYLKYKSLLVIILSYIFITIKLNVINNVFYTNVINPLFWIFILIYLIWNSKRDYFRYSSNKTYCIYMSIISYIHIMIYFHMGIFMGFSKSPYSHKLFQILHNIAVQIIPIIGIEVARGIIIYKNKKNKAFVILITFILILVEIKYSTLINVYANKELFFQYICSNIIPLIACNFLYTYLILSGSYYLTLIYRLPYELIILLSPILPNMNWFSNGSIELILTVLIYILSKYLFIRKKIDVRQKKKIFFERISYIASIIISIFLICFMLGVFEYESISILSNSMLPTYGRGDVIIYKKMSYDELKEIPKNAIIIYTVGNQNIAHRIVNIIKTDNDILYQAKGDSNNVPDVNLVKIEQIKGVYCFHIKYIGFPSIWLYEYFNNN